MFPQPYAKTSKNQNRRAQLLSMGAMPAQMQNSHVSGFSQHLNMNSNQNSIADASQLTGDEMDMNRYNQIHGANTKNHQRNATMMIQQQQNQNALIEKLNINQQNMNIGIPSADGFNSTSVSKNLNQGNLGQKQSQRRQNTMNTVQHNQSYHQRGRSSGVPNIGPQEQQQMELILNQQQQQFSVSQMGSANQTQPIQFSTNLQNSGSGGQGVNNPFRRQKQPSKNTQKYSQQLQMYSSSNRINQQKAQHNKNNSTMVNFNARQQQMQQQMIFNNMNGGHMRSISNSNCSGNAPQTGNIQESFSTNQNTIQNGPNGGSNNQGQMRSNFAFGGDQRKAPSSINLLNQTNISNNLNNSNMLIPGNQGRVNLNNQGQISMTHQNLHLLPQNSIHLTAQQIKENKVTEQQILESEEFFENGKLALQEKKYKDASKMFTKSLQANQTNYDALFYRAVTTLDQELPDKAIADLEELMKICPDYRKTMFIVLSIAYRRVNDYLSAIRTLSKAIHKYPSYLEAFIARGQIYIFQKKWDKALNDFKVVLKSQPSNGMGFLGQADSLKGLGQVERAIESYTKVIELDPMSMSQGLMKRGLLYLQQKQNEEALRDFDKLTELAEERREDMPSISLSKAYFYKAKALKKMSNMNDSVIYFEQVLRLNEDNFLSGSSLYEIAKIKIQQKDFYEANYNLQRSSELGLKQKKLVNYKLFAEGVIFLMKRKTKTGVKLLTQVIDRMKPQEAKAVENSENRNTQNIKDDESHGSLSSNGALMVKQEALADAQAPLPAGATGDEKDYIYPLLYIYRAYGYIVLEEYDKGLKDFIKSSQIKKLNASQHYNMILCQGLKNMKSTEFESAISFFTKASQKQAKKRDPFLLRAISIVEYTVSKPIKPRTKIQMLKDAKKDLNRALEQSPRDESVLFLRGILNFALHRFYDAIVDFERVIDKAEDTSAEHYLARGRCYACLSMFKEAITDLSIAINLNKDLLDAYLNRGKCAYLIGDTGLAFMDFQKLIVLQPKNPSVHIYAGNLLMTTGSYEDATKAFTNADNIEQSPLALYQRSRCHVALNNMAEALKDLNKVIEISQNDKVAIHDRDCLSALAQSSKIDKEDEAAIQKSVFQKAAQSITKLISFEKNENLAKLIHESSIANRHSQIIPSANRTKMDKIRAIKRRKEQDIQNKQAGGSGPRKNDLRFRVQQQNGEDENDEDVDEFEDISELDDKEIERLNRKLERNDSDELAHDESSEESEDEGEANYYKENIFNKEDFYLYRAVLNIYAQEYGKAITDFETCSNIMHQNKVLYPKNKFPDADLEGYESPTGEGNVNGENDDNASQGSSQTDLSDVGLCSLNIHEFSFNIALSLMLSGDYKKALTKMDYIISTIAKKYVNQLWLLRGILNDILGYADQSAKDIKRAYKYDRQNTVNFLEKKEDVKLLIFPQQQRLCNFFQTIKFDLESHEKWNFATIYLKPSFSFPFIKPPNMIPCVDQQIVLENFNLKKSGITLKPEAPWIKKCTFGLKFTEEIYYADDDRDPTPEDQKEYKKRKQRQQERAMEGNGFIRAHSEKVELKFNIFEDDEKDQAGAKEPAEGFIFQDEDGNPVNIAELEGFKGDINDPEAVEAHLAHQIEKMELLQKRERARKKQAREKIEEDEDIPADFEDVDPSDGAKNDFNKLQNITKMKDIAKLVQEQGDSSDEEEYIDENFEEGDYH